MTNFLAELFEIVEDVPPVAKPLAVLLIIVFVLPSMLFALMIHCMTWLMELSPNKQELALRLAVNVGLQPFMVWLFFDSLTKDLFVSTVSLCAFAVLIVTIIQDLRNWQKWRL